MRPVNHTVKTYRAPEADRKVRPPTAYRSHSDSARGDLVPVSAVSLVLVGPEQWRVAIENLIVDHRNLAVSATVECEPREVDIDGISQRDVVLIAVDGKHPDSAIEIAVQVQSEDQGAGIALVLPNMSDKHLRMFHTRRETWSLISARVCGDRALLSAALKSTGLGFTWVDPIITRVFDSLEGVADFDDSAISDVVPNIEPVVESAGQPEESTPYRILVVDDNDDVRLALQILLEGSGHDVMEAGDGEEAFGLARAFTPDLILLDVMMPKMNGFKALELLKTDPATKTIPVVMVTARRGRNDEETARGLGALDYLHKPWSDGEVEMIVNWALARHRAGIISRS